MNTEFYICPDMTSDTRHRYPDGSHAENGGGNGGGGAGDKMNIRQLFADDRAVSPVIGVILMVAITVILAAVIGTFVLGLGDQVDNSSPQANFQFSYGGDWSADTGTVEITHNGGDNIGVSNVVVNIAGTEYNPASGSEFTATWPTTVSTGDTATFDESNAGTAHNPDDEIKIIWKNPSGGSSSTIGSSTVPA